MPKEQKTTVKERKLLVSTKVVGGGGRRCELRKESLEGAKGVYIPVGRQRSGAARQIVLADVTANRENHGQVQKTSRRYPSSGASSR